MVLGLSLSVASTVVLLKTLEERNVLSTVNGRIAIGWLIVEDLAMVLVLVLLPAFAGALGPGGADAHAAGPQGFLAGPRPHAGQGGGVRRGGIAARPTGVALGLRQVARTGSRELFTLGVLTVAIGIAFGAAALFSVPAPGALARAWC